MPHSPEHIEDEEFAPINFPATAEDVGFAPINFGVGQGRTEQKFVPENNSSVTMPATSSASFNTRESKELIEGQEGFFGNTSTAGLFELLGAPGGLVDLFIIQDIKKLPGGIIRDFVETVTGALRERVILGLEERRPTGEFFEGREIQPFPDPLLDVFIKKNPELAQRFNEKMLDLQEANEDFLIRNGLLFGPDDQPTILGNALSQAGTSVSMIAAAMYLRDPRLPALTFGLIQQVAGFQEALEAGKDPITAANIGTIQGIIEAGISLIGIGRLTRIIGSKSTPIVAKIIASMGVEGIEEGVTEALIIAVQNATGVKDLSLEEALIQIFQATFYGSLIGGGTTTTISTAQAVVGRIVGDTVSPEGTTKIARIMDGVGEETAMEVVEQDIDDTNTELEIAQDGAAEQTVTKAAKTTNKQQERVVEILTAMNEGQEFDVRQALDEINPEVKVQRQKQILERSRRARVQAVTKQAIKEEVVRLQAEIQIAEQQGNEEEAARLSERISEIQQAAFADENIFEAVEELEAEGIFVRGNEQLERAVAEIDDVLRPLRAGVRVGRALQKAETRALQDSLTAIVDRLGDVVDPKAQARLQRKVRTVNSIATAESVRRDIVSLARKSAFRKFIRERRVAIDKTIERNTKPKVAELDADSQNSLDSMNKMRLGMVSAVKVKGLPPVKQRTEEQKTQAKVTRKEQVDDFNIKHSRRIQDDMEQGTPTEGVMLQVRYLDILNEKARATPQAIASFEDDLNAFIATGKGVATLADAARQKIVDDTKTQAFLNPVKTPRADIDSDFIVKWDETFGFVTTTLQTQVDAMQLGGTPFDLFETEVAERNERHQRERELNALMDDVSEGEGQKYRDELENTVQKVIDVPLEGHAKTFDDKTRIRMTRGQLVYAWMITREENIKKQVTDPNGKMVWTDKFMAMIEQRMDKQDVDFAEGLFEIYRRSYDRLNATYRRIYNRDLTQVEFYSHISRKGKEGVDASTHNETMFIDMIVPKDNDGTGIFPQQPREIKERVENASSEIKIGNVLGMYKKYVWDTEHFISHGERLRLIDTLMKDKEFKAFLKNVLTPGGFVNFKAHLKLSARSNVASSRTGALWELFESLRQKSFKATLLLNEKIGLGQTATVMSWAPRMPKADFGFGVQDFSLNPGKANAILNKHPTFKDRKLNFDSEIEQLTATGKVFDFMALSIRIGDSYGVRAGAWADILSSMKRKGLSQEEALNDAARFAEASQQSTLPSQRSLAQKSDDPIYRTMTMYRSSLISMFNVSMQSISEYRQADTSTPAKKNAARKKLFEVIVTQNIIVPGLYAMLTGRPLTPTIIVGSSAAIPFFAELLEVIVGVIMNIFTEEDERIYFGGPLTFPAATAFREAEIAVDSMGKLFEDEIWNGLEDAMSLATIETFVKSIQGIIDVTTGFPLTNFMNKYDGVKKLFNTDDPLDAALQLFGYKEEARELTIERLELLTDEEPDTITSQGVF